MWKFIGDTLGQDAPIGVLPTDYSDSDFNALSERYANANECSVNALKDSGLFEHVKDPIADEPELDDVAEETEGAEAEAEVTTPSRKGRKRGTGNII